MNKENEPSRSELQKFLGENLPACMVPATFVRLKHLPLTAKGKIDQPMLPAPTEANTIGDSDSETPPTAIAEKFLRIDGFAVAPKGQERLS
jgi:hypothetical protein